MVQYSTRFWWSTFVRDSHLKKHQSNLTQWSLLCCWGSRRPTSPYLELFRHQLGHLMQFGASDWFIFKMLYFNWKRNSSGQFSSFTSSNLHFRAATHFIPFAQRISLFPWKRRPQNIETTNFLARNRSWRPLLRQVMNPKAVIGLVRERCKFCAWRVTF